ncbi:MAG: DUF177 domain-containing protein [Rhizobiaceae bacterium]|nr:DUF177 domain-containing protein [Rhizobiaceae bacterium]
MHQPERSPISFEVSVARLPGRGLPVAFEADARQRAALAEVHGLAAVEALRVDLVVSTWKRKGVRVEGKVTADIVQECIVTLEPVPSRLEEAISATFLPEESKLGREGIGLAGEILIDVDGPDSPETFAGDRIDVGALAEEYFGLGIDPYPRKSGVALARSEAEPRPPSGELQEKLRKLFPKG